MQNSRREKMGKKYLETKKDTLESSILGVWRAAAAVKEEPETINGSGEHAFEVGTDRYAEYTKKITPGQIEEAFILLDEQQLVLGEGTFTEEQCEIIDALREMTDEEHDELIEQMDDDQLEMYEGILGKIGSAAGKGVMKVAKRFGTAQGRATAALDKQKKKANVIKTKKAASALKKKNVTALKKKAVPAKKKKEEAELGENGTHVNPKDRDELDKEADAKGGVETAKKIKRAQEPTPNQMTEAQSGDKEAYKKFFDAALKKFKVSSPADFKSDEEKKKFYDYIDKNWEGDNEKAEGAMSQVREFKIQSMKAALAQVWGMEEGKNPFAEHKGTKPHKHPHEEDTDEENEKRTKTETGKKPATIDLKPKLDDK